MVFLPGDHVLDMNITVANVTRLTLRAESSAGKRATVVCSESVGLSFTSMVDLKIHSLAVKSCSRKYAVHIPDMSLATVHVALHLQSTRYSELVNCSFHDNNLGTALMVNHTSITLAGNSEFTHNHCESNSCVVGAITAFSSSLTFTGNATFIKNNASSLTQLAYGGAIYASSAVLSFTGISNFMRNSADNGGGAIYAVHNTVLIFNGINNFINNSAAYGAGGAIYTSDGTVLTFNGTSKFIHNLAVYGGAICPHTNTTLTFNGSVYFTSNGYYGGEVDTQKGDTYGGGLYLKTTFSILPSTTVYWKDNHATFGGAIYVKQSNPFVYCQAQICIEQEKCFFQLPGQNLSNGINVQLVFQSNSADAAGSVLYGGAIDSCKLTDLDSNSSGEVFDMIVYNNDTDYNTTSNVSSDPLQICPCESNHPDCSKHRYNVPHKVYPGETFQVPVVAVGQRNGTVPSKVVSIIDSIQYPRTNLQVSQYLQQANNICTTLNYTLLTPIHSVVIKLHAEGSPCTKLGDIYTLNISVDIRRTCPPGFNISQSEKSCVCEPKLAKYCSITDGVGQITRNSSQQFWIGYDNQSDGLILHPHCPFDYCVNHTVVFPLNNTDQQCAYNRSGLLCGACKEGYSLVLGSSHCMNCTDSHLALLIPFAVMGVALVFLLLVCKLTVATGTLSGLVFYANIVGVNRTVFLPMASTDVFSVFIAWLNLDFGIQSCFYNGMDVYSKMWLQFVFPVYIWVLVGLMILVSNLSPRFAKLLGSNPVSMLATLILLSYTKILHTWIAVFYITYLEYPTYNKRVWLYDANVDYLSGKHIPLFLVAVLVFLFLFLPYTLLLLFGQWLQAVSHLRLFSWVNSARLKPFMDSYHAPYKSKHRYWPGLLLVLRCVLFLVFALNTRQDPNVNLLAILLTIGFLVAWTWLSGGVYRNWCLDALECSFALNLIVLAAATFYVIYPGGNHLAAGYAIWYTSVSIALATFIGILAYNIFQHLRHTKLWKKMPKLNFDHNRPNTVQAVNKPVTNTSVEVEDFSRLRESLLEDLS